MKGVERLALKTPDDLDKAAELIAEFGAHTGTENGGVA